MIRSARSMVVALATIGLLVAACGGGEASEPQVFSATTPAAGGRSLPAGDDPDSAVDEEAAVSAAFERYRLALLDQDPTGASAAVVTDTFVFYQEILDRSLDAGPEQLLEDLPFSTSFNVVVSRGLLGDELLDVADGRRLFEVGVERGFIGDAVATIELESIRVAGDEAVGIVGGLPVVRLVRTDGQWLVDLPYITRFALDDNEDAVVEGLTGRPDIGRAELFELVAIGYGSTWAELGLPLR